MEHIQSPNFKAAWIHLTRFMNMLIKSICFRLDGSDCPLLNPTVFGISVVPKNVQIL
jgi:hypothetical protein